MTELTVSDLHASYGKNEVLHGLNLHVPDGAIAAVLGPSGCGKSTLLRVLAGHHPADSGQVITSTQVLNDHRTHREPEHRSVTIVPQEGTLFPHLTVAKNVAFGLRRGTPINDRVDEMLTLVGLTEVGHRYPHQLSGGQQQRVAVARALAPKPDFVLLDEPFSALDVSLRDDLRRDVRQLLRHEGATAVLVTHDQHEALSMADTVAVMRAGVVVQQAAAEQVYAQPVDAWTARFVGDGAILPVQSHSGATVDTALGELPVADGATGEFALIRPERLGVDPAGVWAKVLDVVFTGPFSVVTAELETGENVRALLQPGVAQVGEKVKLVVRDSVWLVD